MLEAPMDQAVPMTALRGVARRFAFAVPLYALVPVAFWLAFRFAGLPLATAAFGIGAAGWALALLLRSPIALLVKGLPKAGASTWVVASSGPLEEGVRLLALVATGTSLRWAASLGQGWAAVEVVFAVANTLAVLAISQRTDAKAHEVRQALEKAGGLQTSPLVGVLERVFASAYHIGSTLLIASNLWLALVMAPVHTALNLAAVRLARRSPFWAEFVMAVVGLMVLLLGLGAFAVLASPRIG